jgi:hypothetical protein
VIKGFIILHLLSGDFHTIPAKGLFPTFEQCQVMSHKFGPRFMWMWNEAVKNNKAPQAMKATHYDVKCEGEV